MSFLKAEQLLTLASMATARHHGVRITDVQERFGVSKRTAQRMLRAMENQFPDSTTDIDTEGHKRWRLVQGSLKPLIGVMSDELAALDVAIEASKRSGAVVEAQHLRSLRDKITALIPRPASIRLAADIEALLESQGFVARPGPKPRVDIQVAGALAHALKAGAALNLTYETQGGSIFTRIVSPYGILTGLRRYLLASTIADKGTDSAPKLYVVENIVQAEVLDIASVRDPTFDLQAYCERSFGVFQSDAEVHEVVLRFAPNAAKRARKFEFHPQQLLEDEPDGSLLVRFTAAGILEMTWHLYIWGDQVEVLSPSTLIESVHPYRRTDFQSLP